MFHVLCSLLLRSRLCRCCLPCTHAEADTSCCCSIEGRYQWTVIPWNCTCGQPFFVFSTSSSHPSWPSTLPDPVPLHPLCANTLCHCLLPSPYPEPTSMTLRSIPVFLQIPQTTSFFQREDATRFTLWVHFCHTDHMTARSCWRSTFHHHAEVCALPDSCAIVLTTVSCVLQLFQWAVLVHISFVSASCLVLPAGECIVTVPVSSCQNTSTRMMQHMMTEGAGGVRHHTVHPYFSLQRHRMPRGSRSYGTSSPVKSAPVLSSSTSPADSTCAISCKRGLVNLLHTFVVYFLLMLTALEHVGGFVPAVPSAIGVGL